MFMRRRRTSNDWAQFWSDKRRCCVDHHLDPKTKSVHTVSASLDLRTVSERDLRHELLLTGAESFSLRNISPTCVEHHQSIFTTESLLLF